MCFVWIKVGGIVDDDDNDDDDDDDNDDNDDDDDNDDNDDDDDDACTTCGVVDSGTGGECRKPLREGDGGGGWTKVR